MCAKTTQIPFPTGDNDTEGRLGVFFGVLKLEIKLKGDDFVIVVTATAVIPDGEEAILTVTDFTGKRKFEIKVDASAPK